MDDSRYGIRTSRQAKSLIKGLDLTYDELVKCKASKASKNRVLQMIQDLQDQVYADLGENIRSAHVD